MLGGGWKLWSRESLDQEIVCYEVCFKFSCTGMYWVAFRLRAGEIREVFFPVRVGKNPHLFHVYFFHIDFYLN